MACNFAKLKWLDLPFRIMVSVRRASLNALLVSLIREGAGSIYRSVSFVWDLYWAIWTKSIIACIHWSTARPSSISRGVTTRTNWRHATQYLLLSYCFTDLYSLNIFNVRWNGTAQNRSSKSTLLFTCWRDLIAPALTRDFINFAPITVFNHWSIFIPPITPFKSW